MPLNLSTGTDDLVPYLKYNAKAGRFYVRSQNAQEEVEVVNPRLAFDMANIRTGWIYYQEGFGPEKVWDPSPAQAAPRPTGPKKFRRGFEVMVFGNDPIPSVGTLGLREFSSTANSVISTIVQMFNEYELGVKANRGSVPFYVCQGVRPIAGTYGTNYEPQFLLRGWVPRSKIPAFDEHVGREDISPPQAPLPNSADDYGAARDGDKGPNGTGYGHGTDGPLAGFSAPARGGRLVNDDIPFAPEWR